ncbi:MAG: penicillin-binding protein 1A [Alphaproteobacteria bacterium]
MDDVTNLFQRNRSPKGQKPARRWWPWPWWVKALLGLMLVAGICALIALWMVYNHYARQLPDVHTLAEYRPSLITKIYDADGQVLSEYARERRIYTPIRDIPQDVINAYLAAEDTGFYSHNGFDMKAIVRAMLVNLLTNRMQGASTITQQVAKTFLLSSERTYTRKIKEIILSRRIEATLSKDQILELYLNQIYLGNGAYGVTAAARTYFNKDLTELTIGERALLAGLPKAPSRYNPVSNPQRAQARRDVVVRRMETEGFISATDADATIATPLEIAPTALEQTRIAPHFSELVRREVLQTYDEDALYNGGLKIHTTLDLDIQKTAEQALYEGLRVYDRRHGWRGPLGRLPLLVNWQQDLLQEAGKWQEYHRAGAVAVVLEVTANSAKIGLPDGTEGTIALADMAWARAYKTPDSVGPSVKKVADVLAVGDVIFTKANKDGGYMLEQLPAVQGAVVAMDARTGAVRAMVGGLGDGEGYNRAVQAKRQPGSSFKPIVYATAMEQGYTPASIMLDAPVVFRNGDQSWKPSNYTERIYGPSTLRRGLEQSRNLITIRLAQDVGLSNVVRMADRFGLSGLSHSDLAVALGTGSFTLYDMVGAYTIFPNQGLKVAPYFISRIQDGTGQSVYRQNGLCTECQPSGGGYAHTTPPVPQVKGRRVLSPQVAYQMTSMMQGVIQRGTARSINTLGRPVAGKTGTTNDYKDAWFIGYTPSVVLGVWIGFDQPQSLGKGEAGGTVAAPIWKGIMERTLKGTPTEVFQVPEGVTFVKIDADTGTLPTPSSNNTLTEVFIEGTEPQSYGTGGGLTPVGEDDVTTYGLY